MNSDQKAQAILEGKNPRVVLTEQMDEEQIIEEIERVVRDLVSQFGDLANQRNWEDLLQRIIENTAGSVFEEIGSLRAKYNAFRREKVSFPGAKDFTFKGTIQAKLEPLVPDPQSRDDYEFHLGDMMFRLQSELVSFKFTHHDRHLSSRPTKPGSFAPLIDSATSQGLKNLGERRPEPNNMAEKVRDRAKGMLDEINTAMKQATAKTTFDLMDKTGIRTTDDLLEGADPRSVLNEQSGSTSLQQKLIEAVEQLRGNTTVVRPFSDEQSSAGISVSMGSRNVNSIFASKGDPRNASIQLFLGNAKAPDAELSLTVQDVDLTDQSEVNDAVEEMIRKFNDPREF